MGYKAVNPAHRIGESRPSNCVGVDSLDASGAATISDHFHSSDEEDAPTDAPQDREDTITSIRTCNHTVNLPTTGMLPLPTSRSRGNDSTLQDYFYGSGGGGDFAAPRRFDSLFEDRMLNPLNDRKISSAGPGSGGEGPPVPCSLIGAPRRHGNVGWGHGHLGCESSPIEIVDGVGKFGATSLQMHRRHVVLIAKMKEKIPTYANASTYISRDVTRWTITSLSCDRGHQTGPKQDPIYGCIRIPTASTPLDIIMAVDISCPKRADDITDRRPDFFECVWDGATSSKGIAASSFEYGRLLCIRNVAASGSLPIRPLNKYVHCSRLTDGRWDRVDETHPESPALGEKRKSTVQQ
ncbi:hypothetical protein GEV33_011305 [Tenebrio molitor]|uniref:Uncharacterized protein n=1 Tax=Tenebrio molitor TaxID=7067 RepID=A0A8J6HBW8_TENMO|nr:hypothetical protein GEV33_011305 [Tenebrio molitor]